MNLRVRAYAVAFLSLALLGVAQADTLTGRVVKVSDGDTITVLTGRFQHRVRLAGIDAPEIKQPFGQASRKHLASMIAGKIVTVEWHKRDKYGRIVGKIILDAMDVCLEQIRYGFAWHYKKYEGEQSDNERTAYAGAEVVARSMRYGLWVEDRTIPPWEYRKTSKH